MSHVGTKIYGFCNGFFGRDDYEDKIIILEGEKWIVCAYLTTYGPECDMVTCANFDSAEEKEEYIKEWSKHEDYDFDEDDEPKEKLTL